MSNISLIDIKEKFSLAYLHAIAAKSDITIEQTPWSVDKLGIDLNLYKLNSDTLKSSSFNNYIRIQLKGTSINTNMISDSGEYYSYSLKKDLHKFPNMYFVLVVLPSDIDYSLWLKQDEEKLILSRCAYFIKIEQDLKKGKISFPKKNILTPEALLNMFNIKQEDFLNEN